MRRPLLLCSSIVLLLAAACSSSGSVRTTSGETTSGEASPAGVGRVVDTPGALAVAGTDLRTTRLLWGVRATADFAVFSGMVVSGDTLFGQWAGCRGGGAGVVAIDAARGTQRWRTPPLFTGETQPDTQAFSIDGGVYVTLGGPDVEGGESTLVGVDAANGAPRWHTTIAASLSSFSAALDQAVVAVGTGSKSIPAAGSVQGFDRTTGRPLWTIALPGPVMTVAADDQRVFATYGSANPSAAPGFSTTTVGLAARTGVQLWSRNGLALLAVGRPGDGVVAAIANEAQTSPPPGVPSNAAAGPAASAPATGMPPAPTVAVVPPGPPGGAATPGPAIPAGSRVVGLDAATGQQRWARDGLRDPGDRAKAADGRLVLGAGAGGMVVLEVATGRTLWVTADTDVLVARADGIVLANGHGSTTVYDPASGRALGAPDSLGAEPDQVTVAPQIGPDHHVYLARGCPGRG